MFLITRLFTASLLTHTKEKAREAGVKHAGVDRGGVVKSSVLRVHEKIEGCEQSTKYLKIE